MGVRTTLNPCFHLDKRAANGLKLLCVCGGGHRSFICLLTVSWMRMREWFT